MSVRIFGSTCLVVLMVIGGGCSGSSAVPAQPTSPVAQPADLLMRVHWLGKDRISADTNSARLMQIWNEPESARVEGQTLSKFAAFLASPKPEAGRAVSTNTSADNLTNVFRPLLDDVLLKESYLEVLRPDTNNAPEVAFAIHLEDARAALWRTNLAAVMESLTGTRPIPTASGWELSPAPSASQRSAWGRSRVRLARVKDWTVLALSNTNHAPGDISDALLARIGSRPSTNWLEVDLDPRPLVAAFALDCKLPEDFPAISLAAFGDGENVHTRGEFQFPKPLALSLRPWTVPTNLISRRLFSLTALRGTSPFFAQLLALLPSTNSPSGEITPNMLPDQVYLWDDLGAPFHNYFALASSQASNFVSRVGPLLMANVNPRLDPHYGSILPDTNWKGGFVWTGLYHAAPFLQPITNSGVQFVYGGFGPRFFSAPSQMPNELVSHLEEGTNLVYFDWEITGQRLVHWRYLDDLYRILFELRGPRLTYSSSLAWVARNVTNLLHSVTEVRLAGADRLTFSRKSTIGLTGLEIDYLANWLELPTFPYGFTSLMATNPIPPHRPARMLQMMEQKKAEPPRPAHP